MAGKADLVNSIVDPFGTASKLPTYDGWGVAAEAEDGAGDPSALDTSPPDGSVRIGPGGGGA